MINLDPTVIRPWREIREYWHLVRGDCARCGDPIDYDGLRYVWVTYDGERLRKVENPYALDVGHKIEVNSDPTYDRYSIELGKYWAPCDTQPEHVTCNRRAGAIFGNSLKRRRPAVPSKFLKTSREW
jgi:hypothetical protein